MRNPLLTAGLAAGLALTLPACTSGTPDNASDDAHTDTPTVSIDSSNALTIAADVYQVIAVDVPHTAAIAMQPDSTAVNTAACTDPTAISGGDSSGMMAMGMDMQFNNCTLSSTPPGSAHTLTVNGSCSNSDGTSAGVEVVSGDRISFTSQTRSARKTLGLHGFSVTRRNDLMTRASGALHLDDGGIVSFRTRSDFSGSAMAPSAGSLDVYGSAGSRLRLSLINNGTDVRLEIDADGDGAYETTRDHNWNNDFWLALIP